MIMVFGNRMAQLLSFFSGAICNPNNKDDFQPTNEICGKVSSECKNSPQIFEAGHISIHSCILDSIIKCKEIKNCKQIRITSCAMGIGATRENPIEPVEHVQSNVTNHQPSVINLNETPMNDQEKKIAEELLKRHNQAYGKGDDHENYISPLGKITKPQLCRDYHFMDSQSEVLIQNAHYFVKESLGLNEKIIQIFYETQYTIAELKNAITNSAEEQDFLQQYFGLAKKNARLFMQEFNTSQDIAEACCLSISYYTGFFKEQTLRTSKMILKLTSLNMIHWIKNAAELQQKLCIGHWLLSAINYLPIHAGEVTRYIDLKPEQEQHYQEGNLITWLQFSSTSEGTFTPKGYEERNTWFHIFSISGRKIYKYSTFSQYEMEVLFKPFSHFLVLKKERKDDTLHIYMREISVGQSSLNVLWVDDKIFTPEWQYRMMIKQCIRLNPKITIIPKSSTKTAMAFIKSQLGKNRQKVDLRIITTMIRENEEKKESAGAILLKRLEDVNVVNIKILVVTADTEKAKEQMRKNLVRQLLVSYTNDAQRIKSFASFQ